MNVRARMFIAVTAAAGIGFMVQAGLLWESTGVVRYLCYVAAALLASTLTVRLPGVSATRWLSSILVIVGLLELSYSETMIMACAATLVQNFWESRRKLPPGDTLFNLCNVTAVAVTMATAVVVTVRTVRSPRTTWWRSCGPARRALRPRALPGASAGRTPMPRSSPPSSRHRARSPRRGAAARLPGTRRGAAGPPGRHHRAGSAAPFDGPNAARLQSATRGLRRPVTGRAGGLLLVRTTQ